MFESFTDRGRLVVCNRIYYCCGLKYTAPLPYGNKGRSQVAYSMNLDSKNLIYKQNFFLLFWCWTTSWHLLINSCFNVHMYVAIKYNIIRHFVILTPNMVFITVIIFCEIMVYPIYVVTVLHGHIESVCYAYMCQSNITFKYTSIAICLSSSKFIVVLLPELQYAVVSFQFQYTSSIVELKEV